MNENQKKNDRKKESISEEKRQSKKKCTISAPMWEYDQHARMQYIYLQQGGLQAKLGEKLLF